MEKNKKYLKEEEAKNFYDKKKKKEVNLNNKHDQMFQNR